MLHELIRHRGLEACGEVVALATPEQLTAVFDLDLWHPSRPGRDEGLDVDRFGEWIEVLVETGESIAARTVAAIDANLVVAGLSRYIRVFDFGVLIPPSSDDDSIGADAATFTGMTREIGGYVVRARRSDAWDAIVALLLELDANHPACFGAVMQGCRHLSNSGFEIDGLDDLLNAPEQLLHDVAAERDNRRSGRGFATPADARAFLQMARRPGRRDRDASHSMNPLAQAYFRAAEDAAVSNVPREGPAQPPSPTQPPADQPPSDDAVVRLLAEAGLFSSQPRALLGGTTSPPSRLTPIVTLMAQVRDRDDMAFAMRERELAFLANALVAGCSVQSRAFTPQEASDAALGICNLGLEHRQLPDAFLVDHDLVSAFESGWAALHEHVSLFVAKRLVQLLRDLQSVDADIQDGLLGLRRELVRQCERGTPWEARGALEVIGMLDLPAWASLVGLLDECPILTASLRATVEGRKGAVSATAFEFISTGAQIQEIRAFMDKLLDTLLG